MRKNLIKSTLAVAILTVAGLGGMKAYETYVVNISSDLLSQNIKAYTNDDSVNIGNLLEILSNSEGGDITIGYSPSYPKCPEPNSYKSATVCGSYKLGGTVQDCVNSDC